MPSPKNLASAHPAATSPKKVKTLDASNQLEALKNMTSVVADTGDFEKIKQFRPDDATTNPTLLYQAAQMPEYAHVMSKAIKNAKAQNLTGEALVDEVCDQLAVSFGYEILQIVDGYVSTECDANLSFDREASLNKARKIIKMYESMGISRDRILIKMASTWECIQACKELEKEGIHCNMTLLFSFAQAVGAAQAGATLISPFVGRILDWYKKSTGKTSYPMDEDPGVQSVRKIYNYYKKYGYNTIVMGASFRNTDEIRGLAGCDKLTISPKLLKELQDNTDVSGMKRYLDPERAVADTDKLADLTEAEFRWMLNEDACATEKLAEGLRNFNKDLQKLKDVVRAKLVEAEK
ncbi:Transaldolase, putative [Perkinsus marinus ATCC 50983]|uniref:Transaldolase n=1 Tax=Perkinsus marinus (strain ATCC 50983 / TXsc) TaxID=423536 RepID=C5K4X6_PERM5|nr:Transaldolase, putative [Perkinsus marinus ATCC 50983]EER20398.1 Transaldolase, putative [Perkinsus marinus ATCC 50983]|eukprot:XP_002788602.1 Transaldolase, putative [Perkinsus marinus ATCC 50983]